MNVSHHIQKSRFEINIDDANARLDYHLTDGSMVITHTFVPPELRGKRIAGLLAKAAFDFARTENLRVVPQCSYIAVYAERNPEAGALIAR
ncbi:MAG: GNAT family N-acetyltransferase [Opitutaceae bacterium]